jgi:release factor glutamine methyltransferase
VTVHALVAAARQHLRAAGIADDEADLDARLLAQRLLGWDAARYFVAGHDPASPGFTDAYRTLVERRAAREPLAYLLGQRDFWDLTFEVSPAVLIPRPETELIVEAVLERFPNRASPLVAADVCTGSGCLAVTLACERAGARITATDVSREALIVAKRNARRHHVADRIRFAEADLLTGVLGPVDLIVANPPYVPDSDRQSLPPEVVDFEPAIALFGGPDGLDVVRDLLEQAADRLRPQGVLIFEIGAGQADAVTGLISTSARLKISEIRRDLQGTPRTVVAART